MLPFLRLADIFTFPHNTAYQGSLREHLEYEEELGLCWDTILRTCHTKVSAFRVDAETLKSYLWELHQMYLSDTHGLHQDCNYILAATQMMMEACLSCDEEMDLYEKEEVTLFPEFGLLTLPEEAWLFSTNAELRERVMASSMEMK